MSSIDYHVSTAMLDWIAETQATDRNGLAGLIAPKKRQKFLEGIINQSQADKLIKMANIPFGFLFLKQPPSENFGKPSLPDFRIVQDSEPLSADFYTVLSDINDKVDWYRDYLSQTDRLPENLPFVGKFSLKNTAEKIAADIAETIGYDVTERRKLSKDGYFSYISSLLEQVGILVFKNGIVGSNTHKKLNVCEFRGFAIADKQVPAIFINGADAASAQLFTLLHETAHIWLGVSGVSNPDPTNENKTEQLCNRVAAEFLVPSSEFTSAWKSETSIEENLERLARQFHVSKYVIVIKAYQNKLITLQEWRKIRQEVLSTPKKEGTGGNPYANIPLRNSKRFTQTVLRAAMGKEILLREGAKLLNTTPATMVELYKRNKGKD
ncbi:ImmA/IrrE family metallo-endopeptidase [Neisseria leonii]|uniref:ImmA/IrrE family metallo-endopeptidase n=1 Tax=Neisseria leonii TaxID=2995413 RepID=UPI00237ABBBA|nr:ImmA/IrrE family metallo-endopeptidase [Neisseria sp. 3986]MDD9326026.1 ImmA/IrrE family metallo-endopeptidase [Neisseria sp. 3986]